MRSIGSMHRHLFSTPSSSSSSSNSSSNSLRRPAPSPLSNRSDCCRREQSRFAVAAVAPASPLSALARGLHAQRFEEVLDLLLVPAAPSAAHVRVRRASGVAGFRRSAAAQAPAPECGAAVPPRTHTTTTTKRMHQTYGEASSAARRPAHRAHRGAGASRAEAYKLEVEELRVALAKAQRKAQHARRRARRAARRSQRGARGARPRASAGRASAVRGVRDRAPATRAQLNKLREQTRRTDSTQQHELSTDLFERRADAMRALALHGFRSAVLPGGRAPAAPSAADASRCGSRARTPRTPRATASSRRRASRAPLRRRRPRLEVEAAAREARRAPPSRGCAA